ncbi:MAG: hypothetical protein ACRDIB_17075 [Ardenticatenaceae bacterium]
MSALLIAASVATQVLKYAAGYPHLFGLSAKFYVGEEGNIPTYYSTLLLLLAALLLLLIAYHKRRQGARFAVHWLVLGVIFLFLALDEATSLHDLVSGWMRGIVDARGILYYPWVLPGSGFVLLVALSFSRFLLHLPTRTRWFVAVTGVLYVGGALITELVEGWYVEQNGADNLIYTMITTTEETLEMAGLILFIHVLLRYISLNVGVIRLRIGDSQPASEGGAEEDKRKAPRTTW